MIRDPDLLRQIMLAAEKQPAGEKLFLSALRPLHGDIHELAEHVQLLRDAGFLEATIHTHGRDMNPKAIINRVTNTGHDFIRATKEDTIWNKAKEKVITPAGSWTLQLLLEYAKHLLRERLGLP
jgi:hypothetical protein